MAPVDDATAGGICDRQPAAANGWTSSRIPAPTSTLGAAAAAAAAETERQWCQNGK